MRPWTAFHPSYLDEDHIHPSHYCATYHLGFDHDDKWPSDAQISLILDAASYKQDALTNNKSSKQQIIIIKSLKDMEPYKTQMFRIQFTMSCQISGPPIYEDNQIKFSKCIHHKISLLSQMNLLFTTKHYDTIQINDEESIQLLLATFVEFSHDQICNHCFTQFILQNDGKDFFRFLARNPLKQNMITHIGKKNDTINNIPITFHKLKWMHLLQYICCLFVRNQTTLSYILKNVKLFVIFYGFIMEFTKYLLNHRKTLIQHNYCVNDDIVGLNISVGPYLYKIKGARMVSLLYSYYLVDVLWSDVIRHSIGSMKKMHIKLLILQDGIHKVLLNYVIKKYLLEFSSNLNVTAVDLSDGINNYMLMVYSQINLYISSFICRKFLKYRRKKQSKQYLKWKQVEGEVLRLMHGLKQSNGRDDNLYVQTAADVWFIGDNFAKYRVVNKMQDPVSTSVIRSKHQIKICCNPLCEKWEKKKSTKRKRYKLCSSCKCTRYCSKRCQKLHWNRYDHNIQCKIMYFC